MRQVLDVFEMLESNTGVEWKLIAASTNSPLRVQAEAVSLEAGVDVTVMARAQKQKLAKNLREIAHGHAPMDPGFKSKIAKRVFARNLNGVGLTEIDFESGEPVTFTPKISTIAIELLENRPLALFDVPSTREEIGSVEGTLQDVGTHYNCPAVRISENRGKGYVWCRLSEELQAQFQDKATYKDVWHHKRVIARGRIKYDEEGDIMYILANDIRRIDGAPVSLERIKDKNFTGGLSVVEYLDRFRDGTLGG